MSKVLCPYVITTIWFHGWMNLLAHTSGVSANGNSTRVSSRIKNACAPCICPLPRWNAGKEFAVCKSVQLLLNFPSHSKYEALCFLCVIPPGLRGSRRSRNNHRRRRPRLDSGQFWQGSRRQQIHFGGILWVERVTHGIPLRVYPPLFGVFHPKPHRSQFSEHVRLS